MGGLLRDTDGGTVLLCALCMHSEAGPSVAADTVINGQAVCHEHIGYVQGGVFTQALITMAQERASRTAASMPASVAARWKR